MKKIIICSLVILSFFSCSRNKFTVDVEMQNANGKTAYLQRMIDNELVNIDSALIENNNKVETYNYFTEMDKAIEEIKAESNSK